ncbi:MAG TPA: DUF4397 domain-containing protein [Acidobacteriaceae bacterium]|nr:DUF4397 domain-containing protein [Acidobacteriaceae bacterium]
MRMILLQPGAAAVRLGALALCAVALAGCQGITGVRPAAQVRIIDASPDAPPMDIAQVAPVPVVPMGLYNVGFGAVSSYIPTSAGTYTHAAMVAGTGQQLALARGTFTAGGQYTLLAGNIAAGLQLAVLKDQATPALPGQIALRILGQATRAGAVDIYFVPAGSSGAGLAPLVSAVSFGANSGYLTAPAGTYSIVVYAAGATAGTAVPLYTGGQVSYAPTSVRTILLVDRRAEAGDPSSAHGLQVITASDYDPAG